jgi:selenide,water dikinase
MKPIDGVRVTLICRDAHTPYSGMLPGLVAGHYGFDDSHIDLVALCRFGGARFLRDEACGLDLEQRLVLCRARPPVPYDLLSINIGSTPRGIPGAAAHAIAVKPINRFIASWERLRQRVLAADRPMRIAVVGAGAGGVELLLAVQYRLRAERPDAAIGFHLFSKAATILPDHNPRARRTFARILAERNVAVHEGQAVVEILPGGLRTDDGAMHQADETLWVAEAGAAPWLAATGLALDGHGFVQVADTLQSIGHANVFAAGDIAAFVSRPLPKSGVYAVREGRVLTGNLRRALLGGTPRRFTPQRRFLSLISTGDKHAVASRGRWSAHGAWVWRWKDWIDRRFIEKYNRLPDMDEESASALPAGLADAQALHEISALAMRCGGCGAKIGATTLRRALDRLQPLPREDVLIGLGEADDAALVTVPAGKVMVHSVDFFRAMIDDAYVFGKIAANHALSDLYAMGAEPQTALAIATVPFGLEAKMEDTLTQMMTGAAEMLRAAGAALVGGHSGEGSELGLGFAVNGLVERDRVMRKGGLRPGDRLILTKPIGTGALLAADMRHKAKGRWIVAAIDTMMQSNRQAADYLVAHGVRACTDVTGFGLVGHLVEMIEASAVAVELELGAIPLLEGAEETARAGILSSLQPQNLRLRRVIANRTAAADDPRYALLFDPQTAGGLLAGVPGDQAEACVTALEALGYRRCAIIGTVLPPGGEPESVTLLL